MEDLKITIQGREIYDETKNLFYTIESKRLVLRHSLKSLTAWESIHKVSFLEKFGTDEISDKAMIDYIALMVIEPINFWDYYEEHPEVMSGLTRQDVINIKSYIQDPDTATTFNDKNIKSMGVKSRKKEIVTSEIIYYWMTVLGIPFECENWNLNRLLTLVRVCSLKNAPSKKMSRRDTIASNKSLNAMRRAQLGSKG